jgi:hypothetical protein
MYLKGEFSPSLADQDLNKKKRLRLSKNLRRPLSKFPQDNLRVDENSKLFSTNVTRMSSERKKNLLPNPDLIHR